MSVSVGVCVCVGSRRVVYWIVREVVNGESGKEDVVSSHYFSRQHDPKLIFFHFFPALYSSMR